MKKFIILSLMLMPFYFFAFNYNVGNHKTNYSVKKEKNVNLTKKSTTQNNFIPNTCDAINNAINYSKKENILKKSTTNVYIENPSNLNYTYKIIFNTFSNNDNNSTINQIDANNLMNHMLITDNNGQKIIKNDVFDLKIKIDGAFQGTSKVELMPKYLDILQLQELTSKNVSYTVKAAGILTCPDITLYENYTNPETKKNVQFAIGKYQVYNYYKTNYEWSSQLIQYSLIGVISGALAMAGVTLGAVVLLKFLRKRLTNVSSFTDCLEGLNSTELGAIKGYKNNIEFNSISNNIIPFSNDSDSLSKHVDFNIKEWNADRLPAKIHHFSEDSIHSDVAIINPFDTGEKWTFQETPYNIKPFAPINPTVRRKFIKELEYMEHEISFTPREFYLELKRDLEELNNLYSDYMILYRKGNRNISFWLREATSAIRKNQFQAEQCAQVLEGAIQHDPTVIHEEWFIKKREEFITLLQSFKLDRTKKWIKPPEEGIEWKDEKSMWSMDYSENDVIPGLGLLEEQLNNYYSYLIETNNLLSRASSRTLNNACVFLEFYENYSELFNLDDTKVINDLIQQLKNRVFTLNINSNAYINGIWGGFNDIHTTLTMDWNLDNFTKIYNNFDITYYKNFYYRFVSNICQRQEGIKCLASLINTSVDFSMTKFIIIKNDIRTLYDENREAIQSMEGGSANNQIESISNRFDLLSNEGREIQRYYDRIKARIRIQNIDEVKTVMLLTEDCTNFINFWKGTLLSKLNNRIAMLSKQSGLFLFDFKQNEYLNELIKIRDSVISLDLSKANMLSSYYQLKQIMENYEYIIEPIN